MFRNQHVAITGFQVVDAEDTVEQRVRGAVIPLLVTIAGEKNAGYANWQTMRPGDPANMMFWPLDPTGVPTRGAVVGSYSYAIPARTLPPIALVPTPAGPVSPTTGGKRSIGKAAPAGAMPQPAPQGPGFHTFLPLDIPGFPAYDYEALSIEEAGPEDWIILSTVKHGDRRKLAFRPPHPIGFRLCADHRSDVAPDLSSIVHDGRPVKSLDDIRKAGLHTTMEVREFNTPGGQLNPYAGGTSSQPPWKVGDSPEKYAISWVGDAAADATGFCNIGFGGETGLFSHLTSGPFKDSYKEKHWLANTNDGPMISGGISTGGYHVGSRHPFTAPLDFEEKPYPLPMDSTYEYKVFLWYDANKKHQHLLGERPGMWRWFTRIPLGETPKCSPTKDYATGSGTNPRRSFSEDSRGIMHQKLISPGLMLSPRPNILRGRVPGTVTKHI